MPPSFIGIEESRPDFLKPFESETSAIESTLARIIFIRLHKSLFRSIAHVKIERYDEGIVVQDDLDVG